MQLMNGSSKCSWSLTVAKSFGCLLAAVGHGSSNGACGCTHLRIQIRHHQCFKGGSRSLKYQGKLHKKDILVRVPYMLIEVKACNDETSYRRPNRTATPLSVNGFEIHPQHQPSSSVPVQCPRYPDRPCHPAASLGSPDPWHACGAAPPRMQPRRATF